ncbi:type 1 glutamine amidotransferase domain-containing protein [Rheinheimera aquimaris]|jgi:putative intracellular protease/amidase|uniref:type 1 glutamine amidotransferase domain-containing protein n=1 Tax=Rheinheimera aquimaris TaxID=412437 RepID=UPI0010656D6B|nr:type 1 glutamine amidotransferase domain-containing protein [Rheinheimera aquimaris]MCD1597015.1 type 1 glutamine amidotransferase domain-containing protein [Rheinheimera aquimaris]|tara:strand:+ start:4464 stop:5312 length:849 start_codon:yes stop_codon:yes gene_type:complete
MFKQTLLAVAVLSSLSQTALAEETSKGQILVLLSSESQMQLQDGKTLSTGYYLNEFGVPADAFMQAGYELVLATPKGNAPVVDEKSVTAQYFGGSEAEMQRIQQVIADIPGIDDTLSLQEVIDGGLAQYEAVFIPGGHAPLIDLANNPQVGTILTHFNAQAKPTAAICHGPIALLSAQQNPQQYQQALVQQKTPVASNWIYQGYKMTIFSDAEETVFEASLKGDKLQYYPGKAMQQAGGNMQYSEAWTPNVVVDRELITGQNPFSDKALAAAMLDKLATATE